MNVDFGFEPVVQVVSQSLERESLRDEVVERAAPASPQDDCHSHAVAGASRVDVPGVGEASADGAASGVPSDPAPNTVVQVQVEHFLEAARQVLGPAVVALVHQERIGGPPKPAVYIRPGIARKLRVLLPNIFRNQGFYVLQRTLQESGMAPRARRKWESDSVVRPLR